MIVPTCIPWGDLRISPSLTSLGMGGGALVMLPYSWGQCETSHSSSPAGGAVHVPPQLLGGPGPPPLFISGIWDCCHSLPELLGLSSFLLPALGGLGRGQTAFPLQHRAHRGAGRGPPSSSAVISLANKVVSCFGAPVPRGVFLLLQFLRSGRVNKKPVGLWAV